MGFKYRRHKKGLRGDLFKYLISQDLFGARSRSRTGTPLQAGDFKSHASTSFAIRAVAR